MFPSRRGREGDKRFLPPSLVTNHVNRIVRCISWWPVEERLVKHLEAQN
jgi:hypothetical protein